MCHLKTKQTVKIVFCKVLQIPLVRTYQSFKYSHNIWSELNLISCKCDAPKTTRITG
jgi:hypothetical protein